MTDNIDALIEDERSYVAGRQTLFDEAFMADGGVARVKEFDYFSGGPSLSEYYAVAQDCGAKLSGLLRLRGSDHRIHCDFIHSPVFNAYAVRHSESLSFVGINLGLYLRLRHLLTMLCELAATDSHKLSIDVIPLQGSDIATVGYVGRFTADEVTDLLESKEDFVSEWAKLRAYRDPSYVPPQDGIAAVAGMLTALAMDYVIMHELIHIVRGHTGYAAAAGLKRLGERAEGAGCSIGECADIEVLRGFEYQADWHAALIFGRGLRNCANTVSEYSWMTPDRYLYLWSFATASVLNAFDLTCRPVAGYDSIYAHPELRYLLLAWATGSGIEERCREFISLWKKMDFQGMGDCKMAFDRARLAGRGFANLGPLLPSQQLQAAATVREFEQVMEGTSDAVDVANKASREYVLPILTGYNIDGRL